jgi:hypothetical protein
VTTINEVYYNPKNHRYQYKDTHRFVPEKVINHLTKKRISDGLQDLRVVGDLLEGNKISLVTWQETTAKILRDIHTQQYLLNRGGIRRMTPEDWKILKGNINKELKLLRNFAEDINKGYTVDSRGRKQVLTEEKFRGRVKLYGKATQLSANMGMQQAKLKSNEQYVWMQRFLGGTDRHCPSCLSYANTGITRIGGIPMPGEDCECRANCLCRVEYYTGKEVGVIAG